MDISQSESKRARSASKMRRAHAYAREAEWLIGPPAFKYAHMLHMAGLRPAIRSLSLRFFVGIPLMRAASREAYFIWLLSQRSIGFWSSCMRLDRNRHKGPGTWKT